MKRWGWVSAAILLAGCVNFVPPSPLPAAVYRRTYLPLVNADWWPGRLGWGGGAVDAAGLTAGLAYWNTFSWNTSCVDPNDGSELYRRAMPEIWGDDAYTWTLSLLVDGPCNDGRGLLFLNEPAFAEQAHVAPERAAVMLHALLAAGWRGPIYAGGNMIEAAAWDDAFIRAYTHLYGSCAAAYPLCIRGLAGWHVHLYANAAGAGWGSEADLDPANARRYALVSVGRLKDYLARRQAEGNPTDIIVDEMGDLVKGENAQPMLAAVMAAYHEQLAQVPEVKSVFWTMLYSRLTGNSAFDWCCAWPASNLIDEHGVLTELGEQWRRYLVEAQ